MLERNWAISSRVLTEQLTDVKACEQVSCGRLETIVRGTIFYLKFFCYPDKVKKMHDECFSFFLLTQRLCLNLPTLAFRGFVICPAICRCGKTGRPASHYALCCLWRSLRLRANLYCVAPSSKNVDGHKSSS